MDKIFGGYEISRLFPRLTLIGFRLALKPLPCRHLPPFLHHPLFLSLSRCLPFLGPRPFVLARASFRRRGRRLSFSTCVATGETGQMFPGHRLARLITTSHVNELANLNSSPGLAVPPLPPPLPLRSPLPVRPSAAAAFRD